MMRLPVHSFVEAHMWSSVVGLVFRIFIYFALLYNCFQFLFIRCFLQPPAASSMNYSHLSSEFRSNILMMKLLEMIVAKALKMLRVRCSEVNHGAKGVDGNMPNFYGSVRLWPIISIIMLMVTPLHNFYAPLSLLPLCPFSEFGCSCVQQIKSQLYSDTLESLILSKRAVSDGKCSM